MPERPKPSRAASVVARTAPTERTVRVALAGLSDIAMVRALYADEQIELIAMGDADARARRGMEEQAGAAVYEDLRSLILDSIRMGLDLLIVALPPHQSIDVVGLAGRSGVALLHTAPFARTVSEATELLRALPNDGPGIMVPRLWHLEPAFAKLSRWLETISPVHAVIADVATAETPVGWRGDAKRSGGGVLLHGAYNALDIMIETLGVPERVHAEACQVGTGPGPRSYDTEDAVVLSARFSRDCIGSLFARRAVEQAKWCVSFHGAGGHLDVSNEGCTLTPVDGAGVCHRTVEHDDYLTASARAFAAVRRGETRTIPTSAADHLPTLATIDAAYLSMRTGAPESPKQFLERHAPT